MIYVATLRTTTIVMNSPKANQQYILLGIQTFTSPITRESDWGLPLANRWPYTDGLVGLVTSGESAMLF